VQLFGVFVIHSLRRRRHRPSHVISAYRYTHRETYTVSTIPILTYFLKSISDVCKALTEVHKALKTAEYSHCLYSRAAGDDAVLFGDGVRSRWRTARLHQESERPASSGVVGAAFHTSTRVGHSLHPRAWHRTQVSIHAVSVACKTRPKIDTRPYKTFRSALSLHV